MLKKVILGAMLMAMVVGFASCSDDDNDQSIQMTDLEENVYECKLNGVTDLNFYPVNLFCLIKDSIPGDHSYAGAFTNVSRMQFQIRATTPSYAPMKVKATMETDTTITLDFTQLLQELTFRIQGSQTGFIIWADSSIVDLVKGKITVQEFWNSVTLRDPNDYFPLYEVMQNRIAFSSPFHTRGKVTLPIEITEDGTHFSKKLVNIQDAGVLNMFKELLGVIFIGKLITENWEGVDDSAWLTANLLFSDMTLNCIGSYDGSIKGEDFSLNMYFECGVNGFATMQLQFQISNDEKFHFSILQ